MDDTERISFLIKRYISNECSPGELRELFEFMSSNENETVLTNELQALWEDAQPEEHHSTKEWEHIYQKMVGGIPERQKIKPNNWIKYAIAATLALTLSIGFYFFKGKPEIRTDQIATTVKELKPGTNTAVLTLGNGTKIVLDHVKGNVAAQHGIQITKTANGRIVYKLQDPILASKQEFNTIETPRGGQYQILMSDGSTVWLNAHSSLKYPISFAAKERVVELRGEAYFEIAKNKKSPFKVLAGKQVVEVLGTHFNINSYEDEPNVKTTLLEGSIRVSVTKTNQNKVLRPGQQALFGGNNLLVNQVDAEEAVAWKNGYFNFSNTNLETIMRQVSRWYNVEVVYQDNKVKNQLFSGNVSRFENASQVLSVLELTGLVHFKIEGRRIIAML